MKKIILYLFIVFMLFPCLKTEAQATEEITDEEYYYEQLEGAIDEDTLDILEKFGISEFSSQEIYSVSLSEIGTYFNEALAVKARDALSSFFKLLCVVVIVTTVKSFFISDNKGISFLGVIATVFLSTGILNSVLNALLSSMKAGGSFMLAFIPIFTVLLSLSGNITSSVAYNAVTFFFAQGITAFINNLAVDIIGVFLSVSIAFSLNKTTNLNRFVTVVNRIVGIAIGFIGSSFAATLSVRGILSSAIDSASSKSVRFLISNLIPIVGSSISEAYSTLLGSINIIKGSVAIVGIIVILVIAVPPIIEGTVYCIVFSLVSYISDIADCDEISAILRAFSSGVRTVILLNILQVFVLIISTGIMLTVKGAL